MVINTNITANTASRNLAESTRLLSQSLARLSSGNKITSPEDDAAGLAQVMKLDAQINRNSAVRANLGNAVSFVQTQDGFLQKVQSALDRMSELSVLSQDITKSNTDLSNYSVEFTQLQSYISDIGGKDFNGVTMFSNEGTETLGVTIDSDASTFGMSLIELTSTNVSTGLWTIYAAASTAITSSASAASALSNIQTAIQNLADMRANVGANLQRLNMTDDQVAVYNENLSAAASRIKDVDVAEESTRYAKANILVQSGTAMLAQANVMPASALQLIG
jgi:flagellin